MKMKRALAVMLSVILMLSALPAAVFAEEFDATAEVTSITDGNTLRCVVEITNQSDTSGYVTVYKSVFSNTFKTYDMQKEKIAVGSGVGTKKKVTLYQDYDGDAGEYAMMHFWLNDTMNPVCDSVISTEAEEGVINVDEIEITEDMVFASSEAEGEHRVTAIADDDLSTYWSAKGVTRDEQHSVTAFLEAEYSINKVGIAFGSGSTRQYVFTVLTSQDGRNYTEVLGETVSALTNEVQYFEVEETIGEYVRVNIVERVEPDSNNWVTIAEIEAFGTLIGYDEPEMKETFGFDDAAGTLLPTTANNSVAGGWIATSMDERNYSSYTPSLGDKLYAEVNNLPAEAGYGVAEGALHLYDNVGRTTSETDGAGGMLVAKRYTTAADRGRYNLSFKLYFPSVLSTGEENSGYWSGFSLTDEMVSGGNDLSHYAAIQIRMDNTDDGIVLKRLISNYFNEGSMINFMDTVFQKDSVLTVSMDVDPTARRADITVTDGFSIETKPVYFNYNDIEYARISAWSGLEAKWLVFNTGAGSNCEMYVDDVVVSHYAAESTSVTETVLGNIDMTDANNGEMTFVNLSDDMTVDGVAYEGSLGNKLYAELTEAPNASGIIGDALHLYDGVGRVTDATNGAGGVQAFVKIPIPNNANAYQIDFTLYAPDAGDYGGFSLGSGREDVNCYGAQLRFMPSSVDSNNLQLNRYGGNGFNKGDYETVVGGITALTKGNPWHVSMVVNPTKYSYDLTIDDGVNSQVRTKGISTSVESWASRRLDTLSFNTGIGSTGDIYVGDIMVTDLGSTKNTKEAVHGIVRLQASHGTGNMLHHQGNEISDFNEKQDPRYTRFVERTGLMDSDGVSFEVMNRPGYFLTIVPGTDNAVQVQPYSNTARFKANATFYKQDGNTDPNGFGKSTVSYASYRDPQRYLYNNSGKTVVWRRFERNRTVFYLRSEASNTRVSDNFNGTSLDKSKWIAQYPWGDHHNHYGLARESALSFSGGNITLKANKIGDNDWPKDDDGDTGIDLDSYGFGEGGWKKYKAYVGVLGLKDSYGSNKFWRQSYMEGSFKQPNCGYGYWTAFWLSGANAWPPETDIFEYLSSSGSAGAHGWFTNMHWSGSAQGAWYSTSNIRTEYHTYALDWGYNYMDMYIDGQCFVRYTGDIVNYQNSQGGMVLIINNGVGGWESSAPSEYGIGLSLQWFRSFQY
ncbi:MAG: AbfB domain-containing protein [Clostridia bacterium]|nr:AbfB domain-containing protein [Clostridia bacterium]